MPHSLRVLLPDRLPYWFLLILPETNDHLQCETEMILRLAYRAYDLKEKKIDSASGRQFQYLLK